MLSLKSVEWSEHHNKPKGEFRNNIVTDSSIPTERWNSITKVCRQDRVSPEIDVSPGIQASCSSVGQCAWLQGCLALSCKSSEAPQNQTDELLYIAEQLLVDVASYGYPSLIVGSLRYVRQLSNLSHGIEYRLTVKRPPKAILARFLAIIA